MSAEHLENLPTRTGRLEIRASQIINSNISPAIDDINEPTLATEFHALNASG